MNRKKIIIRMCILALTISMLAACAPSTPTEDANMKFTEIASTVQAQLTQIALLTPSATATLEATATPTLKPVTPTATGPTPKPKNTAVPLPNPSNGDNSKFIIDVTIPDHTQFKPGSAFTKTWRFQNTGTTTWTTQYKLVYLEGVTGANNTLSINLPKEVKPGEQIDISVNFTAPASYGSYTSWWRLYTVNGVLFGESCSLIFTVGAANATVVTSPTATGATPIGTAGTPGTATVTPVTPIP